MIVFEPTKKGRERGGLEPYERFVFIGPRLAVRYDARTGEVWQTRMMKSRDCYVRKTDEQVPLLRCSRSLLKYQPYAEQTLRDHGFNFTMED